MKIDKKTKYTIAALIGLLFVVTIVHSVAILSMTDEAEQGAQALRSGGDTKLAFSCLVVTPDAYAPRRVGSRNNNINPASPERQFLLTFNVKNQCQYDVKLINTRDLIGQATIASVVQKEYGFGPPQNIDVLNNNLDIELVREQVVCLDCDNGIGNYYYASPAGEYDNLGTPSVQGYTIVAGETNSVMIETTMTIPALSNNFIRIAPIMLKWFPVAALADSIVTSAEIKTYNFSTTNSHNWASDYTKIFYY